MFKRILVPLDGSARAYEALTLARARTTISCLSDFATCRTVGVAW
jgi:hypothetical protein